MQYCSTRDASLRRTGAQAILEGLAPDGGLYVPVQVPRVSLGQIASLCDMDYTDRARAILPRFLDDYTPEEIAACARLSYREGRYDDARIVPLVELDGALSLAELFHGPTLAFKDMALQIMPRLLSLAAKKCGVKDDVLILVATSGDTGKAALEGFLDVPGTRIVVFYPAEGVSHAQYLQMATQAGSNTHVVGVTGNFDDCQRGVKALFASPDFQARLRQAGCQSSSANSINWGRLLPQIVYYFSAYADLCKEGRVTLGDPVNFVVPTGNFGDILAGEYARAMGLPVGRLICASNANNVLVDFFRTGKYDRRRTFYKTMSPSMDILVSSNLERLLFMRSGMDDARVKGWMAQLSGAGDYDVSGLYEAITQGFYAASASEADTARAIARAYETCHYVMDPHTAVGYHVYGQYVQETGDASTPTVLLSTASPYKFSEAVLSAISGSAPADTFAAAAAVQQLSGVPVPAALSALADAPIRHKTICAPEEMGAAVLALL
nr:threonine synthase [Maliibacterium massiliense]